jgi:septal ring factor EnvC (AmiA/AmiB activator)
MKDASRTWIVGVVLTVISGLTVGSGQGLRQIQQQIQQNQQARQQLQAQLDEARRAREQQEARSSALERQIRNLSGQEASLNQQVTNLTVRLRTLEEESRKVEVSRNEAQAQVDATRAEIAQLEIIIAQQKRDVQTLMTLVDRERSNRYIKLLARAENVYDLLVRNHDLNTITGQDLRVIDELNQNVTQLNAKQLKLQNEIARLNQLQAQLEQKQAAVRRDRAALSNRITILRQTRAGQQVVLYQVYQVQRQTSTSINGIVSALARQRAEARRLATQQANEQARLERERREAERRERERVARENARNNPSPPPSTQRNPPPQATPTVSYTDVRLARSVGRFTFPIMGGDIIGNFDGDHLTIRAPSAGSAVRAAQSGLVMQASFVQANSGYTVVIAHTETIWTAYQNLQAPTVSAGQRVRAGQVIGNVGGGALYPENELYFQVFRITDDGSVYPVNPRLFL